MYGIIKIPDSPSFFQRCWNYLSHLNQTSVTIAATFPLIFTDDSLIAIALCSFMFH
nr:MAG TPA: hypothetical protein [Caudoviricetes sp.]